MLHASLHLLIAALRSFFSVMRQGVFDDEDQRFHPLYAYENPMYSALPLTWRAEHRKWLAACRDQNLFSSRASGYHPTEAFADPD